MTIPTVILGATGYVGGELLRLTAAHPQFELVAAVSESRHGDAVAAVFPHLAGVLPDAVMTAPDKWTECVERGSSLALISAAPHGASAALVARVLEKAESLDLDVHAVDCSADFRYRDAQAYRSVYGAEHGAPSLLADFQCAVPEHAPVATTRHIGHPGCFATAMLLAAVPLVEAGITDTPLFMCGITGSTGSGRTPQGGTHHPERHSNLYGYKPLTHRHAPEVEALIADACGRQATVAFVPHSGPFARGIHVTLQAGLASARSTDDIRQIFTQYYGDSHFVRVVEGTPRMKDVVAGNYCHIGVAAEGESVVVMSVLDNLVKGAAGGALQWMNRLWGLPETTGLLAGAPAWT